MLYDLNIAWSPSTSSAELQRTLKFAANLGYHAVALNHTISPPLPPQITNPLPRFPPQDADAASSSGPIPDATASTLPTVLHRATLLFSDAALNYRLPALAAAYDVLALRPTTEKAFAAACLTLSEHSIISLDLSQPFYFHFRPKPCMAAVHRGVRFEICYAQALGGAADARARANFIGNVVQLVRATKGRGLIVSSEARDALALRGPADVVNLLAVWGLPSDKGTEALGQNPRGVVVNEGIKRRGFRGVVDVVGVAQRPTKDGETAVDEKKGKQKQAEDQAAKKRKSEDEAGGEQAMSKRKAKKLKREAMEKASATKT